VLREVEALSAAIILLELIDQLKPWIRRVGNQWIVSSEWQATALELRALLLANEQTKRDA
jgi:hypothetical protein